MKRTGIVRRLGMALAVMVAAVAGLFTAACVHYGGVEGVVQRAEARVAATRPHPDLVPTPFTQSAPPEGLPAAGTSALVLSLSTPDREGAQTTAPLPAETPAPASRTTASSAGSPGAGAAGQLPAAATPTADAQAAAAATSTGVPSLALRDPATATPAYAAARTAVTLTGFTHYWQSWNNCGPATLAMNLSYFGSKLSQADVASVLRPDSNDKNVDPEELVAYARSQGFRALYRVNGDTTRLRLLLSNGVPVIAETWMEPEPDDGMGHYRLLTGYDDSARQWIVYDSYDGRGVDPNKPYAGIRIPYDELDALWPAFDRAYVVVYNDRTAGAVAGILGDDMNDAAMWQRALQTAEAEVQAGPAPSKVPGAQNAAGFTWFNVGTDLAGLGRFSDAASAYDQARRVGLPWRMLWYQFGPFQAYYATGRYPEVIALADATLKTAGNIEELYYWKGMALEAQGDKTGARQAWQRAIQLNKNYAAPAEALAHLN